MEIMDLIFLKAAKSKKIISETLSESFLKFYTNLERNLTQFDIDILYQQDDAVDPAPSNVCPVIGVSNQVKISHTGVNLYDIVTYPLTQDMWINGGSGWYGDKAGLAATLDYIPCEHLAGRKITLNKRPSGENPGIAFYSGATVSDFISGVKNQSATAGTPWTIEVPANAKYMRFTTVSNDSEIQIELGETSSSYKPFSLIEYVVKIPSISVNLFDDATYPLVQGGIVSGANGSFSLGSTNYAATETFVPCEDLAGKTITLNCHANWANSAGWAFYSSASQSSFIEGIKNNDVGPTVPWTITIPENAKYMRFTVPGGKNDVQIQYGSSYTGYEPYCPICYGGTLDVLNGVLTVSWYRYDAKYLTWDASSQVSRGVFLCRNIGKPRNITNSLNIVCNKYKTVSHSDSISTMDDLAIKGSSSVNTYIYIRNSNYTQLEDFVASLDGVYFIYELDEPFNIEVSPKTIATIADINCIYNDWSMVNTITYSKKQ